LKCDGTRAEIRFRLSAKRTSPFKSAGASVQSTTGSRGVRISGSNAMKSTGYPLHSPFSPSLPLPCVTVCHHISIGLYPREPYMAPAAASTSVEHKSGILCHNQDRLVQCVCRAIYRTVDRLRTHVACRTGGLAADENSPVHGDVKSRATQ
jgi:hypothetical protein